ncbi:putative branched-chain amino acid aminotransferase [Talaromyces proteolyticus]|uniref:Branched-chain-amino-acid aminotransferase n=1 Tax=Talaromyces proteolyticus TaxID=1131652 RepID=A0AAD4KXF3_9EURO|nr:putative branched-chain amino acid aminotransferase [Talaromyces proteolyticus]KAH8703316.1 putative branched-chain amino acid aminotransferase [Talaromyces proteolyticus]
MGSISKDIDSTKLLVKQADKLKPLQPADKLQFGRSFTDHILSVSWDVNTGWTEPVIEPYKSLELDPAAAVFHYAFCCFEGMKAYKDAQGNVRLFRPERNIQRLNRSAARVALPTFNENELLKVLIEYARLESRWVPEGRGFALYLRPTLIGTGADVSVSRPRSALLYVIASPVGNYFGSSGVKAISLEAASSPVRAWPGGAGDNKVGGNYAPTIVAQEQASERGLQQVLWLLGDPSVPEEHYITEAGTMNLFVAWVNPETNTKELLTPPLDGTILPGITRDSILDLARERLVPDGWTVSEKRVYMREIKEASEQGRLLDFFGAGTALIVSPIRSITWNGGVVDCGLKEGHEIGDLAQTVKKWIEDIQYGETEHPWSIVA